MTPEQCGGDPVATLLTRARLLRVALAGGAVVGGGLAIGRRGGGTSLAAPSRDTDDQILRLLLQLEWLQESFYAAALERDRLTGDLLRFARAAAGQESEHAEFLAARLHEGRPERLRADFSAALSTPDAFRAASVELEEAALAAYVGQGASLTRQSMAAVAPLVSVEARQAAWVRDLAGVSPAPRAADPGRKPADVLAGLRDRGLVE
jgi:hypothetical protein